MNSAKYLFVDGWGDFSIITDNNREDSLNPILLMHASLLKKNHYRVSFIDATNKYFNKEYLCNQLNIENIEAIFFAVNIDNINSILRFIKANKFVKNTQIYLISINEDLSFFIKNKSIINIVFDEELDLYSNLKKFIDKCNIILSDGGLDDLQIDYDLQDNILEKNVLINVGAGCLYIDIIDPVHFSKISYRKIDIIMNEIESLLNRGVRYFHIMNHSFIYDTSFVEEFCSKLITQKEYYDFSWSCTVIPEFIINKLDLLPLMVKANLKKIELSCESGDEFILKELGLSHTQNDVEMIINSAIISKVPIIATHFVIGFPNETASSLRETNDFIRRILYLTNSLCDIYLHPYFPEKKFQKEIFDKIIGKKSDFVCDTIDLDINDLKLFFKDLNKEINAQRKQDIEKVPLQIQYEHFIIASKYGIKSQVYKDLIEKTYKISYFTNKALHNHAYFSWEVEDSLDSYIPYFLSTSFMPEESLKEDFSNISSVLLNYIKKGLNVKEIMAKITEETNNTITKDYVLSLFREWESNYNMMYVKYLC